MPAVTEEKRELEHHEAQERSAPSGRIVYKAILEEGKEELERPSSALFWSGLAAGLSMGFSLIAEGLLRYYIPESSWRPLITKLGYSVGFLVVILGRQQLFTENTLTPILPLLQEKSLRALGNVLRLWLVVLVANVLGGLLMAWATAETAAFERPIQEQFFALGQEAMRHGVGTIFLRGIYAGWLIALMIWLLPFAEAARVWVIVIITYLVGLGQFAHVIAGSVEVFAVAFHGLAPWGEVITHFFLPALLGNSIGGVTLVAALNHAQVVSGGAGEDL